MWMGLIGEFVVLGVLEGGSVLTIVDRNGGG